MGVLEPITHSEEIKELLNEAQITYDSSRNKMETQKANTTTSLERLGSIKVAAWAENMESFVELFGSFKNIEMVKKMQLSLDFAGAAFEPEQMLLDIHNATMNANELAKAGAAAVGTGALVGIASYGGAMMFGTASTGTAISALSGAAKTNATLAWFGGGSKAVGGLGMAGGKLVLAGIAVVPILAVGTMIAGAKGKAKLAEARKVNEEARAAAAQMDIVTTGMNGIEAMSNNYSNFIHKLNAKFTPVLNELTRIRMNHRSSVDGKVDFNELSVVEQKTLHISWLMAQIYYQVLSTPLLTANGEVAPEANHVLMTSERELKQLRRDTLRMSGDDGHAVDFMWKKYANIMLIVDLVVSVFFLFAAILCISISPVGVLFYLAAAVTAFPIFVIFKDLPQNKRLIYRIIRLVVAIIIVRILGLII